MTLETFGTKEENYFASLNMLIQDVEKKETQKTTLESLIDDAINRNQKEKDSIFIKELTKEQREIIILKTQAFLNTMGEIQKTDELRITVDETDIYIRIRRDKNADWEDIDALKVPFSEIPKPKSRVMKTSDELIAESKESFETSIKNEMDKAFEYNKNLSKDFREEEKIEHNRLYPLSEEVEEKVKKEAMAEMILLWTIYSSYDTFNPNKYHIEITTDHPKKETLYVRLRNTKTREVIGGGAKLIER